MQFSNCGLPSDLHNLSIVSVSIVTIGLLITPKVELAFLDASAQYLGLGGFGLVCLGLITTNSFSLFFAHSLSTP